MPQLWCISSGGNSKRVTACPSVASRGGGSRETKRYLKRNYKFTLNPAIDNAFLAVVEPSPHVIRSLNTLMSPYPLLGLKITTGNMADIKLTPFQTYDLFMNEQGGLTGCPAYRPAHL